MKVSDVVSNAGIAHFTEVALVLVLTVFVGLALYLGLHRKRRAVWARMAQLPLNSDDPGEAAASQQHQERQP